MSAPSIIQRPTDLGARDPEAGKLYPRRGFKTADGQEVELGITTQVQSASEKARYLVRRVYVRWGDTVKILDGAEARQLAAQLRAEETPRDGVFDDLTLVLEQLAREVTLLPYGGIVA